jgi:hypothetical protein
MHTNQKKAPRWSSPQLSVYPSLWHHLGMVELSACSWSGSHERQYLQGLPPCCPPESREDIWQNWTDNAQNLEIFTSDISTWKLWGFLMLKKKVDITQGTYLQKAHLWYLFNVVTEKKK